MDWLQAKRLTDLRATFCHNQLCNWSLADKWAFHGGILKGCRDSPRQLLQCFVQFVSLNVLINVLSIVSQLEATGELIQSSVGKPHEKSCRNLLQTQKCPGRTVFSTFFCNGWKMFSMSFEIAPENAPCMHWCCQVVPQASRRVVWGVLSKMTIPKAFAIRRLSHFHSNQLFWGWFHSKHKYYRMPWPKVWWIFCFVWYFK